MAYKRRLKKIRDFVGVILPKKLLWLLGFDLENEVYLKRVQDTVILKKARTSQVSREFLRVVEGVGNKYDKAFKELSSR